MMRERVGSVVIVLTAAIALVWAAPADAVLKKTPVSGTLRDKDTKQPVPGGTVTLFPQDPKGTPQNATIGPGGRYSIPGVVPGNYKAVFKGVCHQTVTKDVTVPAYVDAPEIKPAREPFTVYTKLNQFHIDEKGSLQATRDSVLSALESKGIDTDKYPVDWDKTIVALDVYEEMFMGAPTRTLSGDVKVHFLPGSSPAVTGQPFMAANADIKGPGMGEPAGPIIHMPDFDPGPFSPGIGTTVDEELEFVDVVKLGDGLDPNSGNPSGALSDTDKVDITVNPVNDPPVNTIPGEHKIFTDTPHNISAEAAGKPVKAIVAFDRKKMEGMNAAQMMEKIKTQISAQLKMQGIDPENVDWTRTMISDDKDVSTKSIWASEVQVFFTAPSGDSIACATIPAKTKVVESEWEKYFGKGSETVTETVKDSGYELLMGGPGSPEQTVDDWYKDAMEAYDRGLKSWAKSQGWPVIESEGTYLEPSLSREVKLDPPNDPYFHSKGSWGQEFDDQWWVKNIGLPAHDGKGEHVIVALIDTGVDMTHPDLAGKIWVNRKEIPGNKKDDDGNGYVDDVLGWNFVDNNNNTLDPSGHGTINAGIVAASTNNKKGIAGINPKARIMALRAMDFDGKGGSVEISRAIFYAANNGAKVINLSIGGSGMSKFEQLAVNYAVAKGALVVAAAGNESKNTAISFPGGLKGVITVSSTGPGGAREKFSNWGQEVDIAAPGVDVLSLRARRTDLLVLSGPDDYKPGSAIVGYDKHYYKITGTSFSAPIVTGVASLIFSKNPDYTPAHVARMILNSAKDIETPGWDQFAGYGALDAGAALAADPEFYAIAKIRKIEGKKKNGKVVIQVHGVAASPDFSKAWIEVGLGDEPEKWKKAGKVKYTDGGLLSEFKTNVFTKPGKWTVRLLLKTKKHGTRESRGFININ